MSTPPQRSNGLQRRNDRSAPLPVRLPDPESVSRPAAGAAATGGLNSDSILRKKVLDQLGELGEQMRLTVNVSVDQGIVSLRGTVDSQYNRLLVLTLISRFCGADQIHHDLTVASVPDGHIAKPRSFKKLISRIRRGALAVAALGSVLLLIWGARVMYDNSLPKPHPFPLEVHFRGKPAVGALLSLHPVDGGEVALPCNGLVRADGTVQWTTREPGDGVFSGTYIMTARLHPLIKTTESVQVGENILPKDLLNPDSSPFKFTVSGASEVQRIELKR